MDSNKHDHQPTPPNDAELDTDDLPNMSRRSFFTRTMLGGGAAIAAGGATITAAQYSLKGKVNPVGIQVDEANFKQKDQRSLIFSHVYSKRIGTELHPERDEQYKRLVGTDFGLHSDGYNFRRAQTFDNNRPGYTQLDLAFAKCGSMPNILANNFSPSSEPDTIFHGFKQDRVAETKFQFDSDKTAATAVRSAARALGALRCGIAKFDERFVYEPMYSHMEEKELWWDKDVPFKPKSVIVMAVAGDYDGFATSPAYTPNGITGAGYVAMSVLACQIQEFIRGLGYQAIGSGNDMGNNVAFGILAGMGEGGRNNTLIMPGIGSRARLCKVFTDFDFGDAYDQPHTWGIEEFCKSCMKCADACPSGAVSRDVETSFYPTYEHADEPGYTWNNHVGVKKWHADAKRCWEFWNKIDASCGNCVAACTFNEPDVWHHWMVMAVNPAMPKFVHSLMAEAHPAFGYGGQGPTPDAKKLEKFWKSGEGMRVNISNKNNATTAGQS